MPDQNIPSNFGAPNPWTDFSKQGPEGIPCQIWEPSRPSTSYAGQSLYVVGGSDPASGKGPYSDFQNPVTNDAFWSAQSPQKTPGNLETYNGSRGGGL